MEKQYLITKVADSIINESVNRRLALFDKFI